MNYFRKARSLFQLCAYYLIKFMKNRLIQRGAEGYIVVTENGEKIISKTISELVENLILCGISCDSVSTGNGSADNKLKDIFHACKIGNKTLIKMYQFEFEVRMS